MEEQDPITEIFAAVFARETAPAKEGHVQRALDAYCRAPRALEGSARGAVAALLPSVLRDAAEARREMRADPAAPGLDETYGALLSELGALAAVLAPAAPGSAGAPGSADELSAEYWEVCAEIRALMEAAASAQPVWDLVRQSRASFAASRARPPPRAPPAAPLADDAEYYSPA